MKTAVITGASSGLGALIKDEIESLPYALGDYEDWTAVDWSLTTGVDIRQNSDVIMAAAAMAEVKVDILVNCAGVNRIDFIPDMPVSEWDLVMDTNARGIFLVTRALLENLRGGTILNIVSNASHVPMTSSLAYNASKGAAAIMTKQMARELKKTHDITVFGVSPNKLAGTGMSEYIDSRVQELRGWSTEEARAYQLAGLPAGEETDPRVLAEFIAFLLSSKERHKFLAGCIIPYGGP